MWAHVATARPLPTPCTCGGFRLCVCEDFASSTESEPSLDWLKGQLVAFEEAVDRGLTYGGIPLRVYEQAMSEAKRMANRIRERSSTETVSAIIASNSLETNEDNMGEQSDPTIDPTIGVGNVPYQQFRSANHGWDASSTVTGYFSTAERKARQRAENARWKAMIDDIARPAGTLSPATRNALEEKIEALRNRVTTETRLRDEATATFHTHANAIATLNHRIAMIERDLA